MVRALPELGIGVQLKPIALEFTTSLSLALTLLQTNLPWRPSGGFPGYQVIHSLKVVPLFHVSVVTFYTYN